MEHKGIRDDESRHPRGLFSAGLVQDFFNAVSDPGPLNNRVFNQVCRFVNAQFHLIGFRFQLAVWRCTDMECVRDVCHFTVCPAVSGKLSGGAYEFIQEVFGIQQHVPEVAPSFRFKTDRVSDRHDVVERIGDAIVGAVGNEFTDESTHRLFPQFFFGVRVCVFRFNGNGFTSVFGYKSVKFLTTDCKWIRLYFDCPTVAHRL